MFLTVPLFSQELGQINLYLLNEDYEKAISELESFINKNPQHPEAHYLLGISYQAKQQFGEALPHLKKSKDLAPGNIRNLLALGRNYEKLGQKNKAIMVYSELRDLDINHHSVHLADYMWIRISIVKHKTSMRR